MHSAKVQVGGERIEQAGTLRCGDRLELRSDLTRSVEHEIGDPLPKSRQHVARPVGAIEDGGESRSGLSLGGEARQALEIERSPIGGRPRRAEEDDRSVGRRRGGQRGPRLAQIMDDDDGRGDGLPLAVC